MEEYSLPHAFYEIVVNMKTILDEDTTFLRNVARRIFLKRSIASHQKPSTFTFGSTSCATLSLVSRQSQVEFVDKPDGLWIKTAKWFSGLISSFRQ